MYFLFSGPCQQVLDTSQFQGLKAKPPGPASPSIPGCPLDQTLNPGFTNFLEECSLLAQYPDLQLIDSSHISNNALRGNIIEHRFLSELSSRPKHSSQQQPQGSPGSLIPDQGYLAMCPSANISLDLPGSGLEPMSNSLLNGLLDKKLDEVYMQHLNENLARCNSHLGDSLLHGLVPPPQPSCCLEGPDSLEASVEELSERGPKISYLNTHNVVHCSSNFSTPVLRISEADHTHLK